MVKGESLYKIATLLGNSPEICRRHYAALVPEAVTTTVDFPSFHHAISAALADLPQFAITVSAAPNCA